MQALHVQGNVPPAFSELVWQKLEEQNIDFFKAYHLRCVYASAGKHEGASRACAGAGGLVRRQTVQPPWPAHLWPTPFKTLTP